MKKYVFWPVEIKAPLNRFFSVVEMKIVEVYSPPLPSSKKVIKIKIISRTDTSKKNLKPTHPSF